MLKLMLISYQTAELYNSKREKLKKTITVDIIVKEEGVERDETFGVVLSNISPAGAKLSKKCNQMVHIVTDSEAKRKQEALA